MDKSHTAALGTALCLFLLGPTAVAGAPKPAKPVALVYSLAGQVTLIDPAHGRRPLRLFERLAAGTALEVATGSRLALAFANGRRYELGERSRASVGPTDLSSRSGDVRPLPVFPRLPRLSAIAEEENPGLHAGSVRIRSRTESIPGLYPRGRAATLARSTVLRFEPVAGAAKYRIEIQDRQGNVVFAADAPASPVIVDPDALQPDARYDWTVRTFERDDPIAKGEAGFVTLTRRTAAEREALRKAVEAAGDAGSFALLAAVDRDLGLLAEARDGLKTALRIQPGEPAWAKALTDLEQRLTEVSGGSHTRAFQDSGDSLGRGIPTRRGLEVSRLTPG